MPGGAGAACVEAPDASPAALAECYTRAAQRLMAAGDHAAARAELERGVAALTSPAFAAPLLNEIGRGYVEQQEALRALAAFADSRRLAPSGSALWVTAGVNFERVVAETSGRSDRDRLEALRRETLALDGDAAQGAAALALARIYREFGHADSGRPRELAELALERAQQADDVALTALAYAELAEAFAADRDPAQALRFARQSALTAQAAGELRSLYRAEWLSGRLLRTLGRPGEALVAYRAAVATLARTQAALATSDRSFAREVLPMYAEYADVMFASTAGLPAAARRERLLEIQATLEQLRLAEVLNYFENQCVVPEVFDPRSGLSDRAIVVYPVVFADRTEILVSTADDVLQFTADVGATELSTSVRLLRDAIERSDSGTGYLEAARQVYDWIIRPAMPIIDAAAPDVLVIVPDGPLRSVPLAVLHDGERFLIERYAVATTPGLSLIAASEPPPIRRVLASGIVEPVQGFSALPFVAEELARVAETYPSRVYSDAGFLSETFEREILQGGYSIVHLATHAQFDSDYRRSFLLAYDDLITLDELEDVIGGQRLSTQPVDLLVLSACQTAAGDDRAALGLAGVAVKAGARAALASLWLINDESTAQLIGEFYRQLASGAESKAAALRGAQLLLMNDERHAHPAFWAPFLLIGDWR